MFSKDLRTISVNMEKSILKKYTGVCVCIIINLLYKTYTLIMDALALCLIENRKIIN